MDPSLKAEIETTMFKSLSMFFDFAHWLQDRCPHDAKAFKMYVEIEPKKMSKSCVLMITRRGWWDCF